MKLAIDYRLAGYSMRGMAKYCVNITNEILESPRMKDVDILLYVDRKSDLKRLPWNVKYRIIPAKNFVVGEQLMLPYYLRKDRIDVFWSPHSTYPMITFRKTKIHATWHDLVMMDNRMKSNTLLSFIKRMYYYIVMKYGYKKLCGVCTVSEFSKGIIQEKFGFEHIVVTPNCISDFISELKKREPVEREDFFFTISGESWYKNLDLLLEYFAQHKEQKLKVAGLKAGSIFHRKCPSNVEILPYNVPMEEILDNYCKCKAFLFVSKYEGFGIPVLEAMASGCKLIVSDAASIPEVCGNNGIYIDPYDINSLADAISRIEEEEIDVSSYSRQIAKFSDWKDSADKLITLLLDKN